MNKIIFIVLLAVLFVTSFIDLQSGRDVLIGVLSTTTFLFGVITVAAIGDRQKRMGSIRDENSTVRAELFQIYQLSSVWGKKFQDRTRELIDAYLVAVFDYKIEDQHLTNPHFDKLYAYLLTAKVQNSKQSSAFSSINYSANNLIRARAQINALIQDGLPKTEVILSVLLGILIALSLLLLNTGSLVSVVVVGGLILALVFSMKLLLSLDNLDYAYEDRILEPYQKTFEEMGLIRYYPEALLKEKSIKYLPKDRPYRLGVFKHPYPDLTDFEMVIVQPNSDEAT